MTDQLPKLPPPTSSVISSAISSLELAAGASPCNLQAGHQRDLFGLVHAPAKYSTAGPKTRQSGSRHLWPTWDWLIEEYKPAEIFGEQVDAAIAAGWLDDVFHDLENKGYACAAADLPAIGVGSPQKRSRIFFYANGERAGWERPEQDDRIFGMPPATYAQHSDSFFDARRTLAGDFSHLRSSDGVPLSVERGLLHGFGNAIVPQVAAEFIKAVM